MRVHFKGWGKEDGKSRWDEWMAKDSPKMAALGTKSGQVACRDRPWQSPVSTALWGSRASLSTMSIWINSMDDPILMDFHQSSWKSIA